MKNKKLLGNMMLILAALIWGMGFVSQRSGTELIEPLTFNASRLILAAVAIGTVALIFWGRNRHHAPSNSPEERKTKWLHTLLGGVFCGAFLAGATTLQQMGLVYTTAGKAGFITALYMLLVPIVNFLLFKKKNSLLVWGAVLIGLAGMYLLCINEGFSLAYGDLLVLLCSFMFCGHILCCDHFVRQGDPLGMSAIQFATAAAITSVIALIAETPSWEKIVSAAIPILYCGLLSGGVAYTLQVVAQKMTDPTIASLLMSLESVFAVLGGALLLNEHMSTRELLGCIVLFVAIVLVQIPIPHHRKKGQP